MAFIISFFLTFLANFKLLILHKFIMSTRKIILILVLILILPTLAFSYSDINGSDPSWNFIENFNYSDGTLLIDTDNWGDSETNPAYYIQSNTFKNNGTAGTAYLDKKLEQPFEFAYNMTFPTGSHIDHPDPLFFVYLIPEIADFGDYYVAIRHRESYFTSIYEVDNGSFDQKFTWGDASANKRNDEIYVRIINNTLEYYVRGEFVGSYSSPKLANISTIAIYHLDGALLTWNSVKAKGLEPLPISTCSELQDINTDLISNYVLQNNIDCSNTVTWNSGLGFKPLGNATNPYLGRFDGNGYNIRDLHINRNTADNVGPFSVLANGAKIRNLKLKNANITGQDNTGGFSGLLLNFSEILNADFEGSIIGRDNVGGVTGDIGENANIQTSSTQIMIEGDNNVGGLAGLTAGKITDSYSSGLITGINNVGGLIGSLNATAVINRTYSYAQVIGTITGGLVGNGNAVVQNSFWDIESSNQSSSTEGTGKNTSQMQDIQTYTNTSTTGLNASWEFLQNTSTKDTWNIAPGVNNGRPFLRANQFSQEMFCYISTQCLEGEQIMGMANNIGGFDNSHTELSSQSNYEFRLCCTSNNQGVLNSCASTSTTEFLRMNNITNAHIQVVDKELSSATYTNPVCLGGAVGSTICKSSSTGYPSPLYTCMGSLASSEENNGDFNYTNAHFGSCNHYQENIYCRLNNPPTINDLVLNSSSGQNRIFDNLTVYPINPRDIDGDDTYVIYNWLRDGISLASINLPFSINYTGDATGGVREFSGNNNDATLGVCTANCGITTPTIPSWQPDPIFGGKYVFEGDDAIQIPWNGASTYFTGYSQWVQSIWLNPRDNRRAFIMGTEGSPNSGYYKGFNINRESETQIRIRYWNVDTSSRDSFVFNAPTPINNWTNLVVRQDNGQIEVFTNGQKASEVLNLEPFNSPSEPMAIGRYAEFTDASFNGSLTNYFLFNDDAFSDEQIMQMYESMIGGNHFNKVTQALTVNEQTYQVQATPADGIDYDETILSNELTILTDGEVNMITPVNNFFTGTGNVSFNCEASSDVGIANITIQIWDENLIYENTTNTNNDLVVNENWSFQAPSFNSYEWICSIRTFDNVLIKAQEGNRTFVYDENFLNISFEEPTPESGQFLNDGNVSFNASINTSNLGDFNFSLGTDLFNVFDDELSLGLNFDNISALGENASFFNDYSVYANNGVCEAGSCPSIVNGKYGKGLDFNNGDIVNLGSDESLNFDEEITISLWVNLNNFDNYPMLVTKGDWFELYTIYILTAGEPVFRLYDQQGNSYFISPNDAFVSPNTWTNLAFVKSTTDVKIYIDGELAVQEAQTFSIAQDATAALEMSESQYFVDGVVDELRIWNRSLSEVEVNQNYKGNLRKVSPDIWNYFSNEENLSAGDYTINVSASSRTGLFDFDTRSFTVVGDVPIPLSPLNSTLERLPVFNWSEIGDADSYDLNVSAPGGVDCFGFYEGNISVSSFVSEIELCSDLDYDSVNENYSWQVRACSGGNCSNWSDSAGFDVVSLNSIELVNSSVDFGNLQPGDNASTAEVSINPMLIRNIGNIDVDVEGLGNNSLFNDASLNSDAFQFFSNKSIASSFDDLVLNPAWLNITNTNQNLLTQLEYNASVNDAYIHYKVKVPSTEAPGSKQSTITVESIPND